MIREFMRFFRSPRLQCAEDALVDKVLGDIEKAYNDGYNKGYSNGYLKGMKHRNLLLGESEVKDG